MGPMIWGVLLSLIGSIVGRIMVALGFQAVTVYGLLVAFDWVEQTIKDTMQGMPSEVLVWVSALRVDQALSIIFSAYAFRYTLQYLGRDSIRRFIAAPPAPPAP